VDIWGSFLVKTFDFFFELWRTSFGVDRNKKRGMPINEWETLIV
jgi:hypothetical protein